MKLVALSILSLSLFGCASEMSEPTPAEVTPDKNVVHTLAYGYDISAPIPLSGVPDIYSAYTTDVPVTLPSDCGGWLSFEPKDNSNVRWAIKCNDGIHYGNVVFNGDYTKADGEIDGLPVSIEWYGWGTPGINPNRKNDQ